MKDQSDTVSYGRHWFLSWFPWLRIAANKEAAEQMVSSG